MADWERTEHRRHRYYTGQHLTVEVQPSRRHRQQRSGSPERRKPSLHRGYHSDNETRRYRRDDCYSDEDNVRSARGTERSRSSKHQHPSPPRAFHIEVPRSHSDRRRRLSPPPPPPSPPQKYQQERAAPGNRRFSVPNLPIPQLHNQGLARHPSAPKPYERRSEDGIASRPTERRWGGEQRGYKNVYNGGHSSDVPPPDAATGSYFDTITPADSRSVMGHKSSVASTSGTLGSESYRYDPLDPRQFRLVKILPETMTNIRCEILTQPLDTQYDYTAISYAWGDADDKTEITLEEDVLDEQRNVTRQRVTVRVTVSLHGALAALRHPDEDVFVWVDSLSIDQQNKDELSRQVQLMSQIYGKATSVAIWLGPERDDSSTALQLMEELARLADSRGSVYRRISDEKRREHFSALVSLFEREYWNRLWVVQEVFIPDPAKINVYCGHSVLPWSFYRAASNALRDHKRDIDYYFPGTQDHSKGRRVSQQQYSFAQVLAYQGPGSLLDGSLRDLVEQPLLEVMRSCRGKLTANPLDKVYGILGLLSERVRRDFPVNYRMSVKRLYLDVVDHILSTTKRLDVLCESIHFPLHVGSAGLPSWCPDWSHMPATKSLQTAAKFSASGSRNDKPRLFDQKRKLEISAIKLDTIGVHGVAVGTLTTSADYLMAFLNWRAIMLDTIKPQGRNHYYRLLDDFSRTLCLNQVPSLPGLSQNWSDVCHHVFASFLKDRLSGLPLTQELRNYAGASDVLQPGQRRHILQVFGTHMMGRSFCVTKKRQYIGMGSGFMDVDDVIVVPLGCNTPIILRPEGLNEYRYVGDIYIHGYMHGEAIQQLDAGQRTLQKYVLH